jgi:hypothetical protein
VSRRYPKYAFDTFRVANRNLDVRFRVKASARINRPAFDEDAANGLDDVWPFDKGMEVLDDGAVELSANFVPIDRHGSTRCVKDFLEVFVGSSHHANSNGRHQVKAASKVDNCANDRRPRNLLNAPVLHLDDEIQAALRINFPEVYSRA